MFSFLSYSLAKPAFSVKEKQKSKSENAKSVSQVAILSQNNFLFEGFVFESPLAHYIGYVVKYKKERFLMPLNGGKPCKIPIKPRIRNKDNI